MKRKLTIRAERESSEIHDSRVDPPSLVIIKMKVPFFSCTKEVLLILSRYREIYSCSNCLECTQSSSPNGLEGRNTRVLHSTLVLMETTDRQHKGMKLKQRILTLSLLSRQLLVKDENILPSSLSSCRASVEIPGNIQVILSQDQGEEDKKRRRSLQTPQNIHEQDSSEENIEVSQK